VCRSGSFTEEYYYKEWLQKRPDLPMVYLPVGWSTYFWSSRLVMAHMPEAVTFKYVEKVTHSEFSRDGNFIYLFPK